MKYKLSRNIIALVFGFVFIFGFVNVNAAPNSLQAAGLTLSSTSVLDGSTIVVTATGLSVSTAYAIYTDTTAFRNFTTSATETSRTFYVPISDTSDYQVIVYLYQAATTSDSQTVDTYAVSTFIPQTLLITVGIAFMVVSIIVVIVGGLMKRR